MPAHHCLPPAVQWHRRLKEVLCTLPHHANWIDTLPINLLTLCATEKEDIHHTPAQLVYSKDLWLPSQFLQPVDGSHSLSFPPVLQHAMAHLQPTPP